MRVTDPDGPGRGDRRMLAVLLSHEVVIVPIKMQSDQLFLNHNGNQSADVKDTRQGDPLFQVLRRGIALKHDDAQKKRKKRRKKKKRKKSTMLDSEVREQEFAQIE